MTPINFYQPKALDVTVRFPTSWNELTAIELCEVARLLLANGTVQQIALFLIRSRWHGAPANLAAMLDHEQAAIDLLPLVDDLLTNNDLTTQPLPVMGYWWRKRYGPDSQFFDLATGEFEDAEQFFIKYNSTKEEVHLRMMADVLWRKDRRKPYAATPLRKKPSTFSKRLPPVTLLVMYLWYVGCRSQLPKLFTRVFSGGETLDSGEPDLMAVTTLIHHGAGAKNGTRAQVRETKLLEFLYDCELMAKQQEQMEEELKQARA